MLETRKDLCIKNKFIKIFSALVMMLLIVQVGFYFIQIGYEKPLRLAIQSLANQESIASNPYLLSQELQNFESIKLLKCSKLIFQKNGRVFIDNSFNNSCETSFFKLNGRHISTRVKAINGDIWDVQFISNNSSEFQLLLWVIRFLIIALALSFLKLYQWQMNALLDEKNLELAKQELKVDLANRMAQISSQVSHDIRSPLAALNMMMEETAEIPEDNRIIIRSAVNRINDIANQLLTQGKSKNTTEDLNDKTIISTQLISPLIDTLISEKRVQFRNKQGVEIEVDLNLGHSLFANINSTEFKRTLSNLINNSIEAFPDSKGKVRVVLTGDSEKVIITLSDNGKGIPENILKKLGEMGVSHGKEGTQSGSGLGVYHAKKTIESFGGTFLIESKENAGTLITMSFPRGPAPSWFVEKLLLVSKMQIVSLDDDLSIHQIWKGRFEASKTSEFEISHITFTSGEEFSAFVQKEKVNRLYLVDYELLNQNATGLDLIEKLNIGPQSILVTSRYEEESIRARCDKLGVRLIPKGMAPFVPIEIQKNTISPIYDYVYIDDDEILRIGWERKAKKKGIKLLTLSSSEEFLDHATNIDKKITHIFIDSSLGKNKMAGEDFAQILHDEGYLNLHIASGYEAEHFLHLSWLKYAGKSCPF